MNKEGSLFIVLILILTGLCWSYFSDSFIMPVLLLLAGTLLLLYAIFTKD